MKTTVVSVYDLKNENGGWLGKVILTDDGMFAAVTDWGNFSYSWSSFGLKFKDFILSLDETYFANKMVQGMAYVVMNKKVQTAAKVFAERILPVLKEEIKKEQAAINSDNVIEGKF